MSRSPGLSGILSAALGPFRFTFTHLEPKPLFRFRAGYALTLTLSLRVREQLKDPGEEET